MQSCDSGKQREAESAESERGSDAKYIMEFFSDGGRRRWLPLCLVGKKNPRCKLFPC